MHATDASALRHAPRCEVRHSRLHDVPAGPSNPTNAKGGSTGPRIVRSVPVTDAGFDPLSRSRNSSVPPGDPPQSPPADEAHRHWNSTGFIFAEKRSWHGTDDPRAVCSNVPEANAARSVGCWVSTGLETLRGKRRTTNPAACASSLRITSSGGGRIAHWTTTIDAGQKHPHASHLPLFAKCVVCRVPETEPGTYAAANCNKDSAAHGFDSCQKIQSLFFHFHPPSAPPHITTYFRAPPVLLYCIRSFPTHNEVVAAPSKSQKKCNFVPFSLFWNVCLF